jgi:acetylcholinesterase
VGDRVPVCLWIHGGRYYTEGSGAEILYNLSWFVNAAQQSKKPFIGIAINYRLGYWGFLAGKELTAEGSLNLGLRDQRKALEWVRENIAAFGGDPNKVTIFGESA